MDTTLYVGLSHQTAMRRKLDVVANNIANMNTTAFRKESIMFQDFVMQMQGTANPELKDVSYVLDYGLLRHLSDGQMVATANPLDVAISGPGYFTVENENGDTYYTRNGHFTLSNNGYLTTSAGYYLLDENGNRIAIAAEDSNLEFAGDGSLSTRDGVLTKITVVDFPDTQNLKKIGDTLFQTDQAPTPSEGARLAQGMIEGSNVNPIHEVTEMIDVLRSYQSTERMLNNYQEMRQRAITDLGKVN
ncbi:MAG: flagellar basal-body rod protein FlgF [Sphingomonadales bacterium]|nr:flagellar basal-body rod protein FlgF [Sphingomonadales bacterium]